MWNPNAGQEMRQLVLERLKFRFDQRIPSVSIRSYLFDSDRIAEDIAIAIEAEIYGKKQSVTTKKTFQVFTPLNWFQHLKQQYFPNWWIEKWPVKKKAITKIAEFSCDAYALFPDIPIAGGVYRVLDPKIDIE